MPVYQRNTKPSDPRLAKLSEQQVASEPDSAGHATMPAQYDNSDKSSCMAMPVQHAQGSGELASGLHEETGETGLQEPSSQAPSSAASTNLPCKQTVSILSDDGLQTVAYGRHADLKALHLPIRQCMHMLTYLFWC